MTRTSEQIGAELLAAQKDLDAANRKVWRLAEEYRAAIEAEKPEPRCVLRPTIIRPEFRLKTA